MKLWDNALNGLSEKIVEDSLEESRRGGHWPPARDNEQQASGMEVRDGESKISVPNGPEPHGPETGPRHWIKWCAISAAVLGLIAGLSLMPGWIRKWNSEKNGPMGTFQTVVLCTTTAAPDMLPTVTALATFEMAFEKAYRTRITEGEYQNYMEQRTCEEQYVGELLGTVTVEAGWQDGEGKYVSEVEYLQAQVYALKPLGPHVAIALKFLDKGDALTTDHYYVYNSPDSSVDVGSLGVWLGWWSQNQLVEPGPAEDGTAVGYSQGYSPAYEVTMPAATTSNP